MPVNREPRGYRRPEGGAINRRCDTRVMAILIPHDAGHDQSTAGPSRGGDRFGQPGRWRPFGFSVSRRLYVDLCLGGVQRLRFGAGLVHLTARDPSGQEIVATPPDHLAPSFNRCAM
jgi:hypothetical protein